jgi:hypothetical protein
MTHSLGVGRRVVLALAMLLTASASAGWAAAPGDALTPGDADARAAAASSRGFRHLRPPAGPAAPTPRPSVSRHQLPAGASVGTASTASAFATGPRYPADLTYHGGQVVTALVSHPIYLDASGACTTGACWGDPERFLRDLSRSDFIHVVDDFVGATDDGRYTVGRAVHTRTPGGTLLTDADALTAVHAAAKASGKTGYGHEYHVFLAPGTDLCFDATYSVCYSPDSPLTFYFCAYHGSVDFTDLGHVLYSVEPYQNVPGCQVRPGTPNGQLVDSTNSVLSHELFETITDPDGNAWWNSADNAAYGDENGDECSFLTPDFYFDPSLYVAGGHVYATQPEYSNQRHACVTSP